jgi:hypothetical protein
MVLGTKTQHKHNKSVTQILHFDRYFAKKFKTNEIQVTIFHVITAISFFRSKGTITGTLTDKEANQSLPLQTFLLKEQV